MTQQEEVQKKARRDLLLVLLILPLGILCVFLVGGMASRLSPSWTLDTSMVSYLEPVFDNPMVLLQPLDTGILTPPAWEDSFLTPGTFIAPPPHSTATKEPPPEPPPCRQARFR